MPPSSAFSGPDTLALVVVRLGAPHAETDHHTRHDALGSVDHDLVTVAQQSLDEDPVGFLVQNVDRAPRQAMGARAFRFGLRARIQRLGDVHGPETPHTLGKSADRQPEAGLLYLYRQGEVDEVTRPQTAVVFIQTENHIDSPGAGATHGQNRAHLGHQQPVIDLDLATLSAPQAVESPARYADPNLERAILLQSQYRLAGSEPLALVGEAAYHDRGVRRPQRTFVDVDLA